ncbi:endonuclease MutS2 [Lottiidibacillus patelloidae]|uniref:Endonuclease MutS2 n=1 Tax=Lottiidibacillus patelloidae TaxID=2670334 RepID=A0A263BWH7_9BACI|nr:endonuclease MutS2 [Lottiidibacillus patelloidae]OZM57922.1 endonuclease MutS2 [Lottiidibacillus patelloidae]
MQQRVYKTLEFNKIIQKLITFASSSLGKEKAEKLLPSLILSEVEERQLQTDEAVKVLRLKGNVPLGGIRNIRSSVKRAEIGGVLNIEELMDVASTVHAGRRLKKFIEAMVADEIEVPTLENYAEQIALCVNVEEEIERTIDDNGSIYDHASQTLRTIRSQKRSLEARIREKLDSLLRSKSKMLSDTLVTIRNDRYVVPVKQEYRQAFGGTVHDQSSSGATLFIEPQAVVAANNELQNAKMKEQREIDKILKELTILVAEHGEELVSNLAILAEIDFMFAKAKYSNHLKGSRPKLNEAGYIRLKKARHPLISTDEVVPLDVELGDDFTAIVITGPNTGGKTVTLKTIGLLTLMTQSGLQIPAEDESEMAIFQSVYADIGDEQSIEQSLSTFSSHMTNIIQILKDFDANSLILFDELGAGTDPQEGAALAISILDEVIGRGARTVATTHYSELKAYAYNRKKVINASVEFDVETLRPTYRLLVGVPGRSNAFEISKRLGLTDDIITRARGQISTEGNKVENMIASLEESQKRAEQEMNDAIQTREHSEKLKEELEQKYNELLAEKEEILEKAEQEARDAVEKAKSEADAIIKELKRVKKQHQAEIKEHELIEQKKKLEQVKPTLVDKKKKKVKVKKQVSFKPGDEVKVLTFGQKGHVVNKASETEYLVQIGIMKMTVKSDQLQLLEAKTPTPTRTVATIKGNESHVKTELDLRGERYEEALSRVDKYIDEALVAGYHQVSIIHGKGTGALRNGVQTFLKNHSSVSNFRYGAASEGGLGVTVVELK